MASTETDVMDTNFIMATPSHFDIMLQTQTESQESGLLLEHTAEESTDTTDGICTAEIIRKDEVLDCTVANNLVCEDINAGKAKIDLAHSERSDLSEGAFQNGNDNGLREATCKTAESAAENTSGGNICDTASVTDTVEYAKIHLAYSGRSFTSDGAYQNGNGKALHEATCKTVESAAGNFCGENSDRASVTDTVEYASGSFLDTVDFVCDSDTKQNHIEAVHSDCVENVVLNTEHENLFTLTGQPVAVYAVSDRDRKSVV